MSESQTAWVVDHYSDRLKERPIKAVAKQQEWDRQWKHITIHVFDTQGEARRFIIERSRDRVRDAANDLKLAKARLSKCLKKFGCEAERLLGEPTKE